MFHANRVLPVVAGLLAAGFVTAASAQLFCHTAVGDFPMMLPPGVPEIPGVQCNGFAGPGITVFMPGMAAPFPGAPMPMPGAPMPIPGGPMPFPNGLPPFPGGAMPLPIPGALPGQNGPFTSPYPTSPQGLAAGRIAGAVGFNHESQVAAQCVAQFGVTWAGAGCVTSRLTVDELNKCFRDGIGGRGCFGDNNTLVQMVRSNLEAAQRERGALNQGIRATTGISVGDIQKYGPLGGPNSEARKVCNFFAGIGGGRC